MRISVVVIPIVLVTAALAGIGSASSAEPTATGVAIGPERLDYFDLKTTPESFDLATLPVKGVAGDALTIDDQTLLALKEQSEESGIALKTLIQEWDGYEIGEVTDRIASEFADIFVKTVVAAETPGSTTTSCSRSGLRSPCSNSWLPFLDTSRCDTEHHSR